MCREGMAGNLEIEETKIRGCIFSIDMVTQILPLDLSNLLAVVIITTSSPSCLTCLLGMSFKSLCLCTSNGMLTLPEISLMIILK